MSKARNTERKLLRNHKFPLIGMRIIKSAVGILLCYAVDMLRGGRGIIFYSQLAVLWCIQDYVSETGKMARQRTIGTVIGAAWGLVFLLVNRMLPETPDFTAEVINACFVSISIILVLYTTVILKKKQASYFSCVVFLSIVVNHISDINPYIFVLNRFLDTMIGILIGVCVNCFELPRKKNRDTLFLSGLDDTLLAESGEISDYSKVELNRMIEDGAQFTISTIRTPASLMEPLRDIKIKLPMIVMDGAALYNKQENTYEYVYIISPESSKMIREYLQQNEIPYFANVIIDDLLLIYYQHTSSVAYNTLIEKLRSSPYRNYIRRNVPDNECVVYYMVIDSKEHIENLYYRLQQADSMKHFKMVIHPSIEIEGYYQLKIYNHNATKENMIRYLKKMVQTDKVVTFGTIENKYDHVIRPGDFNGVVKMMKKDYEPYRKLSDFAIVKKGNEE